MDVGACWNSSEEVLRKSESESIAHGIYENVRHEEGEGIVSEYKRTKRLAEESEMRIGRAKNVVTRLEIKEDDCRRVKMDVEALL